MLRRTPQQAPNTPSRNPDHNACPDILRYTSSTHRWHWNVHVTTRRLQMNHCACMFLCSISMDAKTIRTRLQELAFLNSKATIWFKASLAGQASAKGNGAAPAESAESAEGGWEKLHYSGGLREYAQHLTRDSSPMHDPIFIQEEVSSSTSLPLLIGQQPLPAVNPGALPLTVLCLLHPFDSVPGNRDCVMSHGSLFPPHDVRHAVN